MLCWPGMTSTLAASWGTQKLWITSRDLNPISTCSPTGTGISLAVTMPSGSCTSQNHCTATTSMCTDEGVSAQMVRVAWMVTTPTTMRMTRGMATPPTAMNRLSLVPSGRVTVMVGSASG